MIATSEECRLWKRVRGNRAAYRSDDGWLVQLGVGQHGDHKGQYQVWLEGNLTRLLYGESGKSFTLPPCDVPAAVVALIDKAAMVLPTLAPRMPLSWAPYRVDSSVTVSMQSRDAELYFQGAERRLRSFDNFRRRTVVNSAHSLAHHLTSEVMVRVYDKTLETLSHKGHSRDRSSPIGPRLVRIEEQVTKRSSRRYFGDTADDLMTAGAAMAKQRVSRWATEIGPVLATYGWETIFYRLTGSGMKPERALQLVGPAMALAQQGITAMVEAGVGQSTAYRWASEIRAALSDDTDGVGINFDADDAVLASDPQLEFSGD
jgi:hypothetical protein